MQKPLSVRQVCFVFIAFMPVTKFFILPSIIAQISSNDMWISVLISILFDFLTLVVILSTMRKTNLCFFDLLKEVLSEKGAKIVMYFYLFYFLLKSVIPVFEQKDYIEHTLYINNPSFLYFIPFFFFSYYLGTKKLRGIGRASDVLFLSTIIGFTLLIILSFHSIDLFAIFPILKTKPGKILLGSYVGANWFGDSVYAMFFIGELALNKKDSKKITLAFILQSLITLLFMVIFYCTFSSIAFRQRFALTEISKFTTVINNTGRLDYFGIFLILLSCAFSLSLPLYFASKIMNALFNFKQTFIAPLICNLSVLVIVIMCNQFVYSIQKIILTYFSAFFILLSNVFPIVFCSIANKHLKEKNYATT